MLDRWSGCLAKPKEMQTEVSFQVHAFKNTGKAKLKTRKNEKDK
jgi:hypothetical protein